MLNNSNNNNNINSHDTHRSLPTHIDRVVSSGPTKTRPDVSSLSPSPSSQGRERCWRASMGMTHSLRCVDRVEACRLRGPRRMNASTPRERTRCWSPQLFLLPRVKLTAPCARTPHFELQLQSISGVMDIPLHNGRCSNICRQFNQLVDAFTTNDCVDRLANVRAQRAVTVTRCSSEAAAAAGRAHCRVKQREDEHEHEHEHGDRDEEDEDNALGACLGIDRCL
jgi:ribosomal protein L12E/L44/L45/RPP1/RPP2